MDEADGRVRGIREGGGARDRDSDAEAAERPVQRQAANQAAAPDRKNAV